MQNPTTTLSVAYDASVIAVSIYSPEGAQDLPGTPYGVEPAPAPVLLLHGNGEDHHVFDALIMELRRERTVIAIDTRGQGESLASTAELTYELFAQDVVEVLDRLGVPEVHVAGFSDGAIVALLLGMHHKARVLSLISIGPNLSPQSLRPAVLKSMQDEYDALPEPKEDEPFEDMHRRLLRLMLTHPNIKPEELSQIIAPSLIVAGQYDMIDPEEPRLIANSIKDADLRIIKEATHFVLDDAPWEVFEIISEFISRHDRPNQNYQELIPNPQLEVRKIRPDEESLVIDHFEDVINSLEEGPNYAGWKRDVYPLTATGTTALKNNTLWGAFDKETGALMGTVSLRFDLPDYYNVCGWEHLEQEEVLMPHTLTVGSKAKRMGVARTLVAASVDIARKNGARAVRLNTSAQNVPANILYRRLGFTRYYSFLLPYRGLDISDWTNPYELRLDETAEEQHIVLGDNE